MQFATMSEFFNMGGYAFYVWLSYGSTALLLVLLAIAGHQRHKDVIRKIVQRQQREARHRRAMLAEQQNTPQQFEAQQEAPL